MAHAQREHHQCAVAHLGEDPVFADAIAPHPGVIRRQSLPALPRVVEIGDIVQVSNNPSLHILVELSEFPIELIGGLNPPPAGHRPYSASSTASGRLRRPAASKALIASSAAKASSRSVRYSRRAART